ncbi:aminotransferase class I/II-fold pyridoxal phosphate-dependent enzyme [Cellulophaga baltica]|uniref:DegT/DnrJ/EryC1/StrS family aminotransferase n=1 Tax=Cellulophaga TaxID=104264 RepID=UPI001C06F67F|nr:MULTISPECIES: aminotransferase class I/II-fold pyridoxal phosphate-dependent enzyme [Cellulophaga]MBU2996752.1 aminotransferase class I/II-fold pyridoxal phosphate-dependent enzyme [Cellulophaga baltica]MDO6768148.1 aminotransferase class I/II-fold pyridoxal phosphate-dependent enzyme [Cellulophaga sp. 1_MG-2023]
MSKNNKMWLSSPHMGGDELSYVNEAFDTNWIAPLGPNVNMFEKEISSFIGNGINVVALNSGTSAIHLGLKMLGVEKNDIVLCQSFTFSASANPIHYLGAIPVFIDSEKETWNIDPELAEQAIVEYIEKGQKPKAIIAVCLYGMPYNSEKLNSISEKYDIPILEDSAEALGSSYKGNMCGSFGDIGVLSFNGNKIITTSGGGALLTKSKSVSDKVLYMATQAKDEEVHYQHSEIGYNYRMSNVLAGIGIGQMNVIEDRVESRRRNYDFYKKSLSHLKDITFLDEPKDYYSNRWLTCILTNSFKKREEIREALLIENIESRPLWKPMHLQPVFSESDSYTNGVSDDLFDKGLCLPSGSNLSKTDLQRVINCIIKICK